MSSALTSKPVRAPRPKIPWRRVDGVLLLDKPTGMSSNDALQKARRLFLAEKGGHTGTLDPLASGLLPLCFGEATKFAHDLLDADKTYVATLRLGQRTDTGDAEGRVISERPVGCTQADVLAALAQFRGPIDQVPPMYSALKKDGVPLYKLARQGQDIERAPRRVTLYELECLAMDLPTLSLRVSCSKGTYIRTLAEDLGEVLGCGAHLTALRRTRVGRLELADAVTLDALRESAGFSVGVSADSAGNDAAGSMAVPLGGASPSFLQVVDALVQDLPAVHLDADNALRFCNGNAVMVALPLGDRFRVYVGERFAGVAIRDARGQLQPQRLIRP